MEYFSKCSDATKAVLAEMSFNSLGAIQTAIEKTGGEIVPTPPGHEPTPAIWLTKMAAKPEGCEVKFRWLEAQYDPATEAAFDEWRKAHYPKEVGTDNCPVPHNTYLFGHNPLDEEGKREVVKTIPNKMMKFAMVKALGPPGKENCWVAHSNDEDLVAWMTKARGNASLNCNHPEHKVPGGGWGVPGGDFGTVIPHGTLVRGLKDLDVSTPPPLANLESHEFKFVAVDEWVGFKMDGKSMKFAQHFDV